VQLRAIITQLADFASRVSVVAAEERREACATSER
jgi:hypothetical protein